MKLDLRDRLILPSILPTKANFETMTIIEDLKLKIKITSDDIQKFEIKENHTGSITWNKKGEETLDFEISMDEADVLIKAFEQLDVNNEVTVETYALCRKIAELKNTKL